MLSADEIEAALSSGYELRGLEIKGPGSRSEPHLFAKVTRAMLGMGNLRDGGHVLIGIEDGNPAAMRPGLEDGDLTSWLSFDDIARRLGEYADPPLRFDIAAIELASGVTIAAIQVFEFADIPHICSKSYDNPLGKVVLRKGALYIRPRKVPETSEVASSVEMRDVIQLATEKALRAYLETAERAGLTLTTAPLAPGQPTDDEKYDAERERGWS